MLRESLFAKIHHAIVTECHPEYTGSITIDEALLEATGLLRNEKVLVADCENGNRFETYVFVAPRGSGMIGVNGAAANITGVGHRLIILSFCHLTPQELTEHRPRVVVCDQKNGIRERLCYETAVSGEWTAPSPCP
ncbi:MAG: aspartate 1-decarboxylase [Phycisphaerales bacterium]|nr:aspartate 1-decarboxylase [Phycisphaerae bacterium]NNF44202.1 aspartate 1-decarboxylase [Phycisphaerales bacterium]NNM26319.1 aspartate 1-decarboxylase [Phycisphaerales bacterium]